MQKIFGFFLLASVLLYIPDVPLAKFGIITLQFTSFLMIALSFLRREKPEEEIVGIGIAFILAAFASTCWIKFHLLAVSSLFHLSLGILLILSIVTTNSEVKKFIVWAAVINCLYLVMQKFGWSPAINAQITTGEEGALLENASTLCTFLAIALPFLVAESAVAFPLLVLIAILQNEAGLLLVCWIYLFLRAKNRFLRTFLVLCGAVAVYLKSSVIFGISINNRLPIWKQTIEQALQSPYFGWGLSNRPMITDPVYHKVVNERPDFVYSSILQWFFSTGLIGMAVLAFALSFFFKNFRHEDEDYSLLFLMIMSTFKYPIEIQKIWLVICGVIALWIIKYQKRKGGFYVGKV